MPIDIVNQSDMRESFVGDVKLGQLMVAASLQRAVGTTRALRAAAISARERFR